jgi:hypothetical protein
MAGASASGWVGNGGGFFYYFDFYADDAGLDHVYFAGGGKREVDDSSVDEGAAIGDADVDVFIVSEIRNLEPRIEGKSAMRGGQFFHVEDLSVGGAASMKGRSVPAGDSGFDFADARGLHGSWNMRRSFSRASGEADDSAEEERRTRMNRPRKH